MAVGGAVVAVIEVHACSCFPNDWAVAAAAVVAADEVASGNERLPSALPLALEVWWLGHVAFP